VPGYRDQYTHNRWRDSDDRDSDDPGATTPRRATPRRRAATVTASPPARDHRHHRVAAGATAAGAPAPPSTPPAPGSESPAVGHESESRPVPLSESPLALMATAFKLLRRPPSSRCLPRSRRVAIIARTSHGLQPLSDRRPVYTGGERIMMPFYTQDAGSYLGERMPVHTWARGFRFMRGRENAVSHRGG
jgi:hypothetical protein